MISAITTLVHACACLRLSRATRRVNKNLHLRWSATGEEEATALRTFLLRKIK